MPAPTLVWFRNDLRVHDNEALAAAAQAGGPLVLLYCLDPRHTAETRWGFSKTGPFRMRFLLESLRDLRANLRQRGADLVVRRGRPEDVVPELVRKHGVEAVCFHKETPSEEAEVEQAVRDALSGTGVRMRHFWGHTLYHINDLPFAKDEVPDVYSQFRKGVEKQSEVRPAIAAAEKLAPPPDGLDPGPIPSLSDLGFDEDGVPDERGVLPFHGGETAGLERLHDYLWEDDLLKSYKKTRNGLLGADYSSKFSAWLAHGCLSPRTVYWEVKRYEKERTRNKSTYWLVFELIWRDFFRFVAWKVGDRLFRAGGPKGAEVDWRYDEDAFERWKTGTTGIPFVDANMRELDRTGFMSNRGRQNVASFLAKNLGLDWRMGAAWFEHKLVDYDVASNWGNWAYQAGVGNDPKDRYFNIVKQARRYDADAAYVKRWLPELKSLPPGPAHEPWTMTLMDAELYDFRLSKDYPAPMLDLDASYRRLRRAS